jgi:O-antigen biosynthesis protein
MPKVSIIIPVWGSYFKYLDECLESVKKQTFTDYEVIVVDDQFDLPTSRNKGIKSALGEYLLILDVDDKLSPDYIEKTIGKGDIVSTYLQLFGDSNRIMTFVDNPSIELFQGGNQTPSCALIKKDVFNDIGGYDEKLKEGWEDYDLWYRAIKKGYKITIIKEPLYFYRKHGSTMSSEAGKKSLELQQYILNK